MKKITEPRYMYSLLILSWLVYFVGYIARLDYGAVMVEIIHSEGVSRSLTGLISTGASLTYALGQIASGFLGDRFSPRYVMFSGLVATAACNLLMPFVSSAHLQLLVWCANGFAQAMLWPPMLRIFTEYYREADLSKMYVRVSTSNTAGTIAVYLLASFCIAVSDWRTVFYVSSALGFLTAIAWLFGMDRIEKHREAYGIPEAKEACSDSETKPALTITALARAGIFFMAGAILLHGILKDSVTTWMPTLIRDTYNLGSAASILSTVIMPVFSMLCLYFASFLNNRVFRNEATTSSVLYGFAAVGSIGIRIFSGRSPFLSLLFGTIITSAMYGTNLMLITAVPAHFSRYGRASTLTGVLNAFTYAGSAISTYGVGALSEQYGWNASLLIWMVAATVGAVLSVFSVRPWTRFLHTK
ncbi:MAG: MFS transporter [Clostridia bacterium]|nr:MFS transporter [Clostridia bacterium]